MRRTIPTEPIGSIPRPLNLIKAFGKGDGLDPALESLYDEAIRDTIARFEATGSPVITDGEQRKYHNFWTYSVQGMPNTSPDGFKIPFSAGHVRRMPRLTVGPFRYKQHADSYLDFALRYAHKPVKQAVISPSALSLMYPPEDIPDYPRDQFIRDLLHEHETEVRTCLGKGAHAVQIDFTEGRLAVKIDPTGALLQSFIELNNLALSRFSAEERTRIGVHTCPGSDRDSTHSAAVDYAELLPSLFQLKAGIFYVALAGEKDRVRVLKIIREHLKPEQRVFVGVVSPIDPRIETAEEIRDRILEVAAGNDRRLWVLAVLRRHVHQPGKGLREDSLARARHAAGIRALRSSLMGSEDDESQLLRSVALQNARIIQLERERVERALFQERERLRITLASIGDAVISTDAEGRVVFLNGVAEALTGWPEAEAAGRPLPEVFNIINEATRGTVDNPALRALHEGRIVDLANHTVLMARDGTERPIDDSAAPMRNEAGVPIGAVLVFRDVTERRRAEEARAQLALIVQSSEDAILSKTLDGVIQSWNPGAERLFGYSRNEAVGQNITLLIPPERVDEEFAILERLRRGERVEHFETVRVAKNGRRLDISLTVSPVKNSDGQVIGASKIARDITARKRAEEGLRESEERHRFLSELAASTQPLSDPSEVVVTATRMLAQHLKVDQCAYAEVADRETFVVTGQYGPRLPEPVGRWPIAALGAECARRMQMNQPYVIDKLHSESLNASERLAYPQTNVQAILWVPFHNAGKLVAAMVVHQKVPRAWTASEVGLMSAVVGRLWESIERTRVSRGLYEAAERLALAFRAARLGDWSWNAATDLVTLSARAAEIFGVPPNPITTTRLQGLLHDEDRDRARQAFDRTFASGDFYDVEYRVNRPDGKQVWISAKGQVQFHSDGSAIGMLGILQDITEKKELEQELRRRAIELADADRKKDDFIALLAHELRNPLAPLRTGLQVMSLAAGDANAIAKTRTVMDRQLSHMVRLIDDLLDVSRLSRNKLNLQKSRVLLAEVVSHALEAAGPAIEAAGHVLTVSLPAEPIVLDADLTRLVQVFGNLLTNSAKYTERGGRIWLTAALRDGEVAVSIRDSGIGIPRDALPRLFEMFSQVDRTGRSTGGLGIGLALVKGLVETHGGVVTAESPGPGEGSTFTVCLPVSDSRAETSTTDASGEARPLRTRWKVLVVDDNKDGATSLADLLELLGNDVHLAYDGIQAIEVAEEIRPDIILMDIGMPRLNGLDATRQIRERPWGRGVTIVALSGWGQEADRDRSRAAGCDEHLVKPVSMSQLEKFFAGLPTGNVHQHGWPH